jgi:UDP-N-acetylmuramoyl-tripeptide--D-alanyl-D-alanine ligase
MAAMIAQVMNWPELPEDALPMALWSAAEIAAATGGTASADFLCSGVATDSREVGDGTLFVALKGESMDGHAFVEQAFAAGASAVLVDRPVDGPHVLVADTFAALQALAAHARARTGAKVIGVTGSVGKTGVKEAIWAALDRASRGAAHRSLKSYNNHVGVPLSLARMPARSAYGVFEMGMNHAGEIAALSPQVRPHVAVITAIAPAHIENLGSMEAIADAKAEIFLGLEPGGVAIIPADTPHYGQLRAAAERLGVTVVSFGLAAGADVRLLDAVAAPGGGSLVTAELRAADGTTRRLCYTVASPGEHWVANSLAVMAAVRAAGADLGAAGLALAEMEGLAGRGARSTVVVPGGTALVIDESYNANPASMRATLASLARTPARRRIAVLGSMKELGDFAPGLHAALAAPLVEAGVDHALLVGPEMAALAEELGKAGACPLGTVPAFAHCGDCDAAIAALAALGLKDGDAVLVKGSNSVGLGRLVAALLADQKQGR